MRGMDAPLRRKLAPGSWGGDAGSGDGDKQNIRQAISDASLMIEGASEKADGILDAIEEAGFRTSPEMQRALAAVTDGIIRTQSAMRDAMNAVNGLEPDGKPEDEKSDHVGAHGVYR